MLLGLAAIATAWATFQAAHWRSEQALAGNRSTAARVEANRAAGVANRQVEIDVTTSSNGSTPTPAAIPPRCTVFRRFRPEFRPAVTAWIATKPLTNTNAPLTPFDMPQYRSAATEEADALEEKGNVEARASQRNVQRADRYALAVVLFATSLFFAGISGRLSDELSRRAVLVMGVRYVRRRRRLDGDVPLRRLAPPPSRTGFSPLPDDESTSPAPASSSPGRLDGCRSSLRHRRSPTPGGADCRYERGRVTTLGSTAVDLARTQFALTSLPLPLRAADARPRSPRRRHADALAPLRRRGVAATDEVLRDADADQLRDRRRHRPRPGVPVRHELGGLLQVRGRRVRGAARDRGACGLHAGGDLPRAVDLRLESPVAARPPGDDLDRGARHGSRRTSSSRRTRGCSTRPATWSRTAARS